MEPQRSSYVWNHFIVNETKKALCKHCDKQISFHGRTSNLIKHMNRKHQEIFLVKQESNQKNMKSVSIPTTEMNIVELKGDESNFEMECTLNSLETQEAEKSEQKSTPEQVVVINIDAVCRICLSNLLLDSSSAQHVSLSSLFNPDVTYQDMFKVCTGFELDETEPQNVCHLCSETLQAAYKFRMQCIETQKILKDWFKIEKEGKEALILEEVASEKEEETGVEEFLVDEEESFIVLSAPFQELQAKDQSITVNSLESQTHFIEKPFECDICGAQTSTKTGIGCHIKTKHFDFNLKCKYCNSQYRSRIVLNAHIRRVHPEMKSPLKCQYCDYTTPNFPNLFRHRLTHTRKKLHKCIKCGREFVTKDNLKTHEATHSDERPFSCVICKSTFKTKKSLGVHMKSHRDPDYECLVCRRGFLTNQLMRNHVVRLHPEFDLPPPGTILNKTWRIKKATQELKESVVRLGFDPEMIKSVIIDESYLNSSKKYLRKNKIEEVEK